MTSERNYVDSFQMQVSELEMLQSSYCNPGEFVMDDPSVLADITSFLEQKSCPMPSSRLQYTINLQVKEVKYEVCCTFPCDYPAVQPEIYIRSTSLSRQGQHKLNEDVMAMIDDMERGELCVGLTLQWLEENGPRYYRQDSDRPLMPADVEVTKSTVNGHLRRYWIYSHHIYNKAKRRSILEYAKDFNITGFCLPGKPGIICAEGEVQNCVDFWHRVKQLSWKKIVCAKEENEDNVNVSSAQFCHFTTFEEMVFESGAGHGHHAHMDMGEFLKYLDQHNCRYAFKDYFGFDGKLALP